MANKNQQQNAIQRIWEVIKPAGLNRNALGDNIRIPLFNRGSGVKVYSPDEVLNVKIEDLYRGYLYSAIRNRANRTAQLAVENLKTVKRKGNEVAEVKEVHPYLTLIDESPSFSNNYFWKAISTYLDLAGVAYIYVLRAYSKNGNGVKGNVKEFKVLNSFNVTRVFDGDHKLQGYKESFYGMERTISPAQMIEIRNFNPFNLQEGWAMVEAAKEDQYLSQKAGVYSRNAINNNVGQRGLLTTDVILEPEDLENFKAQLEAQSGSIYAGKFLVGNGPTSLTYTDMQIDLDKLALDKINEISREKLFATAGVSKTILGIEQSGVTRETGKVQSDLFLQNQIIPQLQEAVDALNQDYKNAYPKEYAAQGIIIWVDSPLRVDREAELKDVEILKAKADTLQVLLNAGVEKQSATKLLELPDLKFSEEEVEEETVDESNQDIEETDTESTSNHIHNHHEDIELDINELDSALRPLVMAQQTSLQNEITNVQRRIIQACISKVTKNELTEDQEEQVIAKSDRNELEKELALVISSFLAFMIPLFATQTLKKRFKQFGKISNFVMDSSVRRFITDHAASSAESHLSTVIEEIYKVARQAAEEGKGRDETVSLISRKYNETVSKNQAQRIARTEANFSVASAQYHADKQFIKANNLEGQAFKRWVTRSENPCPYCQELERKTAANPIPFDKNFVNLGGKVEAEVEQKEGTAKKAYVVGYEPIGSGTLHPNCSCIYELVIINQ